MNIKTYKLKIAVPYGSKLVKDYGRKAQGMFLQCIREIDMDLSEKLHSGDSRRPYSLTRLYNTKLMPEIYNFSVSIADVEIQRAFQNFILQFDDSRVIIDNEKFPIIESSVTTHKFPEFKEPKINTRIKIDIKTPILLSSSKRRQNIDPMPYPSRILANLWDTWSNLLSPLDSKARDKFLDAVTNQVSTPIFNIKTVKCIVGKGGSVPGLLGYIIFEVENSKDLEALLPMFELAKIWGIGSHRTRGYGRVYVNTKLKVEKPEKSIKSIETDKLKQVILENEIN